MSNLRHDQPVGSGKSNKRKSDTNGYSADRSRLSQTGEGSTEPQNLEPDTDQSDYYRNLLQDVFEVIRLDQGPQQELLQMIRNSLPHRQIRDYLDRVLSDAPVKEESNKKSKQMHDIPTEKNAPQSRSQTMDISYLCLKAPYKVPAKPWTNVTDDDDLVSHLVSLYMTWDYPFYAFFDRKSLIEAMQQGNLNSDFCSPFLVNALLANACDYSEYAEVYTIAGDMKTKGAAFLAEAESYMRVHSFERGGGTRLATLQATLLLYERYSVWGNDDLGYTMLHRAIEMAEELNIVNCGKLKLKRSQFSEEMIKSIQRTAWGLFQIDTIVHTNFLKPTRVHEVSMDRLPREEINPAVTWMPYPISDHTRPSYMNQYFDEACTLSYIARDISRSAQIAEQKELGLNKVKQGVYNRLRQWEKDLPEIFDPTARPAPHILLLRMRYHALMINLCCDNFGNYSSFSTSEKRAPMNLDPGGGSTAAEVAIASARDISAITQLMRTEYGMKYVHQFAMYAVNVALYTLLEQSDFDILDPDFLSLASAFYAIANRSQVGKSLYHFFKLSVRGRAHGKRLQDLSEVPAELMEILDPKYGFGQTTITEGDTKDRQTPEEKPRSNLSPGLRDMIGEYEKLSMGKEQRLYDNREAGNFEF